MSEVIRGPIAITRNVVRKTVRAPGLWFREMRDALRSPILGKELRVASRQRRTYALRAGYLLVMLVITSLVWYNSESFAWSGSNAVAGQLQAQSRAGEAISLTLGWIQLVAIMLVAPMLTCSAISDEIDDRTLDVLLVTPLSAFQIVVGKLLSRMAHVFLLILLGSPLLLAMRIYGGFDLAQLAQVEILCLVTGTLAAAVGILMSTWEHRSWRSVMMSLMWLVAFWAVLPLVVSATLFLLDRFASHLLPYDSTQIEGLVVVLWAAVCPFVTLFVITGDIAGIPLFLPTTWCWATNITTSMVLTVVMLWITVPLIRRRAHSISGGLDRSGTSWWQRALFGWSLGSDARTRIADDSDHGENEDAGDAWRASLDVPQVSDKPIMWRELRLNMFESRLQRNVARIAVVILMIWFYWAAKPWRNEVPHGILVFITATVQFMTAMMFSTNVITQEKQAQTWHTLLCTPMTPFRIMWDKYLGVIRRTMLPFVILMAHLIAFRFIAPDHYPWRLVVHIFLIGMSFSALVAATGVSYSLLFNRNMASSLANLLTWLGIWMFAPIFIAIMGSMILPGRDGERLMAGLMSANPYYWIAVAMAPLDSGPQRYDLPFWDTSPDAGEFTAIVLVLSLVIASLAVGLIVAMSRGFNAITGRSS